MTQNWLIKISIRFLCIVTCILDFLSSNHDKVSATKLEPSAKAVIFHWNSVSYSFFKEKGLSPDLHLALLTGVKLNNNRTQYSRPAIFWQCNQDTDP